MVRTLDKLKLEKFLNVLVKHPEGLWVRKIAKETHISPSTVEYYLQHILSGIIDNIGVKDNKDRYFGLRIIKLKPKIIESIKKEGFEKVYKYLEFSKKGII